MEYKLPFTADEITAKLQASPYTDTDGTVHTIDLKYIPEEVSRKLQVKVTQRIDGDCSSSESFSTILDAILSGRCVECWYFPHVDSAPYILNYSVLTSTNGLTQIIFSQSICSTQIFLIGIDQEDNVVCMESTPMNQLIVGNHCFDTWQQQVLDVTDAVNELIDAKLAKLT